MKRYLLILALCACHKTEQVKEEATLVATVKRQTNTEKRKESDKAKTEESTKTTGPIKIHESRTTDVMGWVPPPPEAPTGSPSQWKPVKRVVDDKETKIAPSTTEKKVAEQDHAASTVNEQETTRTGITVVAIHRSWKETIVGLSLMTKIAMVAGAVALLVAVTAFINPNLLGMPTRAIRWLIARFNRQEKQ